MPTLRSCKTHQLMPCMAFLNEWNSWAAFIISFCF
jgi:hypothetical protein